jgi:hypothetical protein
METSQPENLSKSDKHKKTSIIPRLPGLYFNFLKYGPFLSSNKTYSNYYYFHIAFATDSLSEINKRNIHLIHEQIGLTEC